MTRKAALALAAVLTVSPAAAQEASSPEAVTPVAAVCELHVWPADAAQTFNTLMDTDWATFATVEKYSRQAGNPLAGTQASVELQKRVFEGLDLPALFGLPGYVAILHDTPLASRVIRSTKGPLLAGRTPCYAELVTDDVFFQQSHLYDVKHVTRSQVISTFRFRRFDGRETPAFSYGSYITRDLFDPRKKPEMTLTNAITQFETVFAESVTQFAGALQSAGQAKPKGSKSK